MPPTYYNKNGKEITTVEWCTLLSDQSYRVVKQETLPNGYRVSTVWLGLNHQFMDGVPLIFVTKVFKSKNNTNPDGERYSTEQEAIEGHKRMVDKWCKKV